MTLHDAADQVEFLGAVRGGDTLGNLVLGLVRYGGEPAGEEAFRDRLAVRDRASCAP